MNSGDPSGVCETRWHNPATRASKVEWILAPSHDGIMKGIRPASRLSRAATFGWIAASIAWTAALVAEHRSPIAIALVPVIAVGLVALSRRKKPLGVSSRTLGIVGGHSERWRLRVTSSQSRF